jgi:hypothetical protein
MAPRDYFCNACGSTHPDGKTTCCSFCGASVRWRAYAEHLDRHHRGGKLYRDNGRPLTGQARAGLLAELSVGVVDAAD